MSIINDLSGGKIQENEKNSFNVFIQFDNDEPKILAENCTFENFFEIVLDSKEQTATFTDIKSGKIFKIFTK